ncbi:MAG TPA: YceI family protein [Kofleriaceae bacterium]|nr:YceI family protein [Kofleriaceae bacterium]
MARYVIGNGSQLSVKARSSVHDTVTVWNKVTGTLTADVETLATAGAEAAATVDMTEFDAGDWLKNRKLRKDYDMDAHPRATFELSNLSNVVRTGQTFTATAHGVLGWRGKRVNVAIAGKGTLSATAFDATGTFELDIRNLGLQAPKVLMFKVQDEVTVEITLRGVVQ